MPCMSEGHIPKLQVALLLRGKASKLYTDMRKVKMVVGLFPKALFCVVGCFQRCYSVAKSCNFVADLLGIIHKSTTCHEANCVCVARPDEML